jgi:hypothetical protein
MPMAWEENEPRGTRRGKDEGGRMKDEKEKVSADSSFIL